MGGLIQTASGSGLGLGTPLTKRSGWVVHCRVEHGCPAGDNVVGAPEVHLFGGQHRDAPVPVLGIVPTEERSTEGLGLALVSEPSGKRGMVLQGLELSLGERIVIPRPEAGSTSGSRRGQREVERCIGSSLELPDPSAGSGPGAGRHASGSSAGSTGRPGPSSPGPPPSSPRRSGCRCPGSRTGSSSSTSSAPAAA